MLFLDIQFQRVFWLINGHKKVLEKTLEQMYYKKI